MLHPCIHRQILLTGLLTCMCACNCTTEKSDSKEPDKPAPKPEVVKKDVVTYVTTEDSRRQFEMSTFKFDKPGTMSPNQVMYDKTDLSEITVDVKEGASNIYEKITEEIETEWSKIKDWYEEKTNKG